MTRRIYGSEFRLVILLSVVLLAGWLGSRGLNEPDEGRFAEVAREMALQGDWLTPTLNGVPHFQKPPLTYWVTAVFIRLFGANEWAVRLTSALAAFGTLLFTMYIAGVLYGESCRWKAGLVLVVSTGFAILARLITTDMLLTFWITASIAGLVGYVYRGQKGWICVFYAGMGCGFLTKGPLGILIPALAAIAIQGEQWQQHKPVARLFWLRGLPITLMIGLSWHLLLIQHDRTLFNYFFRYEFIDRIATNAHDRAKPPWFYPMAIMLGLVPWVGFGGAVLRSLWGRRRNLNTAHLWLFIGWVVIPYAILSLMVSKLATYLLPFTPPLAIVIARWLEHPATGDRWRRPALITACVTALFLLAFPILTLLPAGLFFPATALPAPFLISLICAAALFLFLARALGQGLDLRAFMLWMASTWACVLLALFAQADALMTGGTRPVRRLAEYVTQLDPDRAAPVFICGTSAHGMEFYLRRLVYRSFSKSDVVLPRTNELRRRIVDDDRRLARDLSDIPAFIVIKSSRYLLAPELHEWRVITQDGPWMLLATQGPMPPRP